MHFDQEQVFLEGDGCGGSKLEIGLTQFPTPDQIDASLRWSEPATSNAAELPSPLEAAERFYSILEWITAAQGAVAIATRCKAAIYCIAPALHEQATLQTIGESIGVTKQNIYQAVRLFESSFPVCRWSRRPDQARQNMRDGHRKKKRLAVATPEPAIAIETQKELLPL